MWGALIVLFALGIIGIGGFAVYRYMELSAAPAVAIGEPMMNKPIVRITDPQRGPADAPITVVYYTDFGCDSCALTWPMIQALEKEPGFAGNVRFVWKDFPGHKTVFPESYALHKAGRCAASQGKFWEFQAAAFEKVDDVRLRRAVLTDVLAKTSISATSLQSCMDSVAIVDLVEENYREGQLLGLTGTPTFFINEKRIDGFPSYAIIVGNIRNMLARIEYDKK